MNRRLQHQDRVSWIVLQIVLMVSVVATPVAQAQSFTVLYTFTGPPDGALPLGTLIDANGSLYGTTLYGGTACGFGCGTVFSVHTGKETVLHSFTDSPDGASPWAGMVRDKAGNLYGTTRHGGDALCECGVVFKLSKTGKETVLYAFRGVTSGDGSDPLGGLVRDASGNLYGTASSGGAFNVGIVFRVNKNGKETVLYSFAGDQDGGSPNAGLVMDKNGNLYGTTLGNGAFDRGTVFKLNPAHKETLLYSFKGSPDGEFPVSSVILDSVGNLYGTTMLGGDHNCGDGNGCGTVFKLGKGGRETVLHSFIGTDGANPEAGLVIDANGNLYGTTEVGGSGCGGFGCGTVFKLNTKGKYTVLHNFNFGSDGATPLAGLVIDAKGRLYGTADQGGDLNCSDGNGCGVVFKIRPR